MQDLTGVDGALLATLKELLDAESVTVAARRMGTTQPAMSRSLARLRRLTGDALLVQVGRGLQRTERARELQPRVDQALEALRTLLAPAAPTSPRAERRVVRIAASDYALAVVLQPWIARLRSQAPGVVVQVEPVGAWTIDPLAYGELDLALAPRLPVVGLDQFVFKRVLEDRFVCALRRGHPRARGRLTLKGYLALEHVMVGAMIPAVSAVQAGLHRVGKSRTVVARVPTFMSALLMVAQSDLAVSVPERFVAACGLDVVARPLPFAVEGDEVNLVWHPRRTGDGFHRWMREGIAATR